MSHKNTVRASSAVSAWYRHSDSRRKMPFPTTILADDVHIRTGCAASEILPCVCDPKNRKRWTAARARSLQRGRDPPPRAGVPRLSGAAGKGSGKIGRGVPTGALGWRRVEGQGRALMLLRQTSARNNRTEQNRTRRGCSAPAPACALSTRGDGIAVQLRATWHGCWCVWCGCQW